MGGFSIIHWIILLIVWAVWMIPLYRLLGRIGWSRSWTFVALFPPAAMVLLWCISFGRWRTDGVRSVASNG